jgi:hypothetical protein
MVKRFWRSQFWRMKTPCLKSQGVFKVGGKKEKESDLLLIKFQKDHYFGFFKKC